ncbi:MAG TPA: hypothetical protein VEQ15_08820 [Myxococcales bacterium]|nr:hypothetical protein [Myxococcales bacterium]
MKRLLCVAVLLCACGARPGDPCGDDSGCGGGLVCLKGTAAETGVCSFSFSGPGERCLSGGDCKSGLFCSNDLSIGTRQFAGECRAAQDRGGPCSRDSNCLAPLRCQGARDGQLGSCA